MLGLLNYCLMSFLGISLINSYSSLYLFIACDLLSNLMLEASFFGSDRYFLIFSLSGEYFNFFYSVAFFQESDLNLSQQRWLLKFWLWSLFRLPLLKFFLFLSISYRFLFMLLQDSRPPSSINSSSSKICFCFSSLSSAFGIDLLVENLFRNDPKKLRDFSFSFSFYSSSSLFFQFYSAQFLECHRFFYLFYLLDFFPFSFCFSFYFSAFFLISSCYCCSFMYIAFSFCNRSLSFYFSIQSHAFYFMISRPLNGSTKTTNFSFSSGL